MGDDSDTFRLLNGVLGVWDRWTLTIFAARGGGVLGLLGSPGSASSSMTELLSISGKCP